MNTKLPNFGGTNAVGNDSKYFQTTKKGAPLMSGQLLFLPSSSCSVQLATPGEIHELKEELSNPKVEKKTEAVKKVIAAMTVGKDVSMLFTDVVNCIQTQKRELKKLVYLYLINYAKSQPDLAVCCRLSNRPPPRPMRPALCVYYVPLLRVSAPRHGAVAAAGSRRRHPDAKTRR